jgi:hypothetical protein
MILSPHGNRFDCRPQDNSTAPFVELPAKPENERN